MVDCARLESECPGNRTAGSNPALSANLQFQSFGERLPRRFARKTETLGRAKRKGVGGKEFLPALAFRRRILYFALQNVPLKVGLCLPRPPVRTQQ